MTLVPRGLAPLLILLAASSAGADALALQEAPSTFTEEVVRIPLEERGQSMSRLIQLEATVFRPKRKGRFPLVVINHGAVGGPDRTPRWRPTEQARWFVEHGFVVVVPMRRGNSGSEGEWAEGFGACEAADYFRPAVESGRDIAAAIDFMGALPDVDRQKVVLVGHSAGGLASLAAAAAHPASVMAVFNFAGGRGSLTSDNGVTRHMCSPRALVDAAERLGKIVSVPTFWFYSENDRFFPPAIAGEMFRAFNRASKHGAFITLPPFETEGHHTFWKPAGMRLWTAPAERILKGLEALREER